MTFTLLRRGELIAVPPPEEARASSPPTGAAPAQGTSLPGAVRSWAPPQTVAEQLEEVVASYGAEEAIVGEHHLRPRGTQALATSCSREAFGLTAERSAASMVAP